MYAGPAVGAEAGELNLHPRSPNGTVQRGSRWQAALWEVQTGQLHQTGGLREDKKLMPES